MVSTSRTLGRLLARREPVVACGAPSVRLMELDTFGDYRRAWAEIRF